MKKRKPVEKQGPSMDWEAWTAAVVQDTKAKLAAMSPEDRAAAQKSAAKEVAVDKMLAEEAAKRKES